MIGKNKRSFLLVAIALVLSILLAACGNDKEKEASSEDASGNKDDSSDEGTEITWWAFPNFQAVDGEVGKYETQIIEAFNEKHPDIKVNLEMITFEGGPEKLNVARSEEHTSELQSRGHLVCRLL